MSQNSMVLRNELDYHSRPYLGPARPGNMSVDTQDPIASQNFSSHGNGPVNQSQEASFNQSDYLLQTQQPYRRSPGFNFFHNFSGCIGNRDANQNSSQKLPLKDIEPIQKYSDCLPESPVTPNPLSPLNNAFVKLEKTEQELPTHPLSSHYNQERTKAVNHSPISTASLSDTEVPTVDKTGGISPNQLVGLEGQELPGRDQEAHSNHPTPTKESPDDLGQRESSEKSRDEDKTDYLKTLSECYSPLVHKECEADERACKSTGQTGHSAKKTRDPLVKEEIEDTVKEHLEEAIRQHHHRVTQPISRYAQSPPPTESSAQNTPNTPTSPKTSQPLLPSPLNSHHIDPSAKLTPSTNSPKSAAAIFQPKAPHIRHLNFKNFPASINPGNLKIRGDFPDFPPFLGVPPPHHFAGLTFPHPQLPPAIFGDFIHRSRSNTVPATDSPRSRSSSFSSLPERHLAGNGGRKDIVDGKELYYCHLCSFIGATEAQFGNHMNTHFEHQCPHCDYKSRTEGRLKRHIKDFHTEENPEDFTGGRITRKEPGKPKFFRCRQCDYVAEEKEDYWKHARSHIKDDKCLQCPKCPFVTEYKHHLEYHLRNHFGSKPFKCNKCNYSCVNKSMLNSHMKSHTNVYQYRCQDCTYATKYCHSLKLHLSKYNHQPATVLNTDGSLPVDGTGDFELVSKRGPPRGPRLNKLPDGVMGYEPSLDSNLLAMQAGTMGVSPNPLNGMAAMMGTLWPNGLTAPPPLIPVSGLAPLNVQLPPHERRPSQGHSPNDISPEPIHSSLSGHNGLLVGKCHFCDFVSRMPQEMAEHVVAEHNDKQDIFKMLQEREQSEIGAMMDYRMQMKTPPLSGERGSRKEAPFPFGMAPVKNLNDFDVMRAKYALENSSGSDGSPGYIDYNKTSPSGTPEKNNGVMPYYDCSDSCSPNKSPQYGASLNSLDGSYGGQQGPDERQLEFGNLRRGKGEHPLDLTSKMSEEEDEDALSPGSARKRAWDDISEEHNGLTSHDHLSLGPGQNGEDVSSYPRKRSRKGKAYKLDMISIKLQEQYSEQDNVNGDLSGGENEYFSPEKRESNTTDEAHALQPHIKTELADSNEDNQFEPERPGSDGDESYVDQARNGSSEKVDAVTVFSGNIDRRRLFVQQKSPFKKMNHVEYSESSRDTEDNRPLREEIRANIPKIQKEDSPEEGLGHMGVQGEDWVKYECKHCGIAFRDCIMYTMHMGYHGFQDPFTCNRCGEMSRDKIEFFLHIARKAHA